MSDVPIEAYEGLAPSPERIREAERESAAKERGSSHLPPQNLEAEEAVLGAMLMSTAAIAAAEEVGLERDHFYRPSHRLVWDAIHAVRRDGDEADELAVIHKLKATEAKTEGGKTDNALALVGGANLVMALVERVPAVANAKAYAKEVRATWVKRTAVEVGHEVARIGYDPTVSAEDTVSATERELLRMVTSSDTAQKRGDTLDGRTSMERWAALYDRRRDPELLAKDTLAWSSDAMTERMGRALPGGIYCFAGWTKHGKTWSVADEAEAFMEQGARGLMVCGEMSDSDMVDRWVAMGGHDYTKVQVGALPWPVIRDRVQRIEAWQRKTMTGRLTIERLRAELARAKLEGRPYRFVVIDHLYLLMPDAGQMRMGKTDFIEYACAELKALAEEYGVTLLLVVQLTKPERAEKGCHPDYLRPPTVADLKGASGIPQIATTVAFVHRQMNRDTGLFDGQLSWITFPWHRFRERPRKMRCEFTLPDGVRTSAYRFRLDEVKPSSELVAAVEPAQQALTEMFDAEVVGVEIDDDIPF